MPSGTLPATPGTSTTVRVTIARDPALVRTVRLVAAAVARRRTADEELVEEVRLAVGEACALLVGTDAATPPDGTGPVEVSLGLEDRLRVVLRTRGPMPENDGVGDVDGIEPWALLRGLLDDFEVSRDDDGVALTMSWSLG